MRRRGRLGSRLLGRLVGDPVPPSLIEANRLFSQGDYQAAAERFEMLALTGRRHRPRNTARLLVEAGRARLLAGQEADAMRLFRQGLGLLAEERRWRSLRQLSAQVVQGLQSQGYTRQANEIAAWLNGQPLPAPEPEPAAQAARRPLLPTRCPACGGPVDPREVEWADEQTAECVYCGGLIRAQEG